MAIHWTPRENFQQEYIEPCECKNSHKLQEETDLSELSVCKKYPQLLEEWDLVHIETLDKVCYCNDFPLRNIYHITNHKNGRVALVGKLCVKPILERNFREKLISMSVCKKYPTLLEEWGLSRIEKLEQAQTCICGDFSIREVCHIKNQKNGLTALVDIFCIKTYFENNGFLTGTHKIFDALKRIQKDIKNSANVELINYGSKKGILTLREHDFYLGIWGKNNNKLDQTEISKKQELNKRIISSVFQHGKESEQAELDKGKTASSVPEKIGEFKYSYGSASQLNRKIEFWEDIGNGESGAVIFALVNGKYEEIGRLSGDNIIIENNSVTDRKKAIMAQGVYQQNSLKPDSNLNDIQSEKMKEIFSKIDPKGNWKVSIRNQNESKSPYERVVKVSLFDVS